jgi:hypothetical protein
VVRGRGASFYGRYDSYRECTAIQNKARLMLL